MAHVIGDLQAEVLERFLAKEIKKHLRNFAKTTEKERSEFSHFLEDWESSLSGSSDISRLYQTYRRIEGRTYLLEIKF